MKAFLVPVAAAFAILCVGAAVVMGVGKVRTVDADRHSASVESGVMSAPDGSSPGSAGASPEQPASRRDTMLRYEAATSGSARAGDGAGLADGSLQRIEPRAPLSRIGQALPPKPKMPGEWKPTTLFQPVATAAGLIEAKGYTIAVAGIDPVKPEESCDSAGRSWPCGARARAAFRAFLRGRAISCVVPPQPEQMALTADCAVGKTDVGTWLVSNGWARAAETGPLKEPAEQAKTAGRGIYGAAPNLAAPLEALATSAMPAPPGAGGAILNGPAADLSASGPAVPVVAGPFPPAPAPPMATPPAGRQAPAQ